MSLRADVVSEGRQDQSRMSAPPASRPLTLTVTVNRPAGSPAGVLYEYDSFGRVPVVGFNARSANAARSWRIPAGGGPFTVTVRARTSDTRVFRALSSSAP